MKSILHKTHRNNRYTTINLTVIEDPKLTATAKAIHFYAMSRPPEWDLNTQDIINRFREGKAAIYAAMRLLTERGYLHREQLMNGNLKSKIILHWYEEPLESSRDTDFRDTDFRDTDFRDTENRDTKYIPKEPLTKEAGTNGTGTPLNPPRGNLVKNRDAELLIGFDVFWQHYPRKITKKLAQAKWLVQRRSKVEAEVMIRGAENYALHCRDCGTEEQYICHPTTFLNQARYEDYQEKKDNVVRPKAYTVLDKYLREPDE